MQRIPSGIAAVLFFTFFACGGGSDGLDTGIDVEKETGPLDQGTADPGTADPGITDPGQTDPVTSDHGSEGTTDTPADIPGDPGPQPGDGDKALEIVRQVMAEQMPDEVGWTAWAPGAPVTGVSTQLDDLLILAAQESWFVYVDPEPAAMLEHPVHYFFIPTEGSKTDVSEYTVPPEIDVSVSGVLMVQQPVSAGLPTEWEGPDGGGSRAIGDYGDAPDDVEAYIAGVMGGFPTHQAHDGAFVEGSGLLFLGEGLSVEMGADDSQDPDGIPNLTDGDSDDGLLWAMWKGPAGDWWHRAIVTVTVAVDGPDVQYLNLLADLDRDGTWDEPDDREWPVKNLETDVLPGSSKELGIEVPLPPDAIALDGAFWIRLTVTKDPIADGWIGKGDLGDGEVEDYFIQVNDYGGGKEPLPPGPGPDPDPDPFDEVCKIDVHKRAIVIAGVDLKGKDHIVEGTANKIAKAFQDLGYGVGPVVSGTPEQVVKALDTFFAKVVCLDEALIYFVAHGSAKDGGHLVFAGTGDKATRWKAADVFAALKKLGACPAGKWIKGECDIKGKACKQTILFEACHSGAFAGQIGQFEDGGDGRNVFFSSEAATSSWAINGMGVFSKAFLAALQAGSSPGEAFNKASSQVQNIVNKKVGKVQKPQMGASKPPNCPCDCCGDGTVQKTQKVVFGVAQPQPVEDCDPVANPDGCTLPEICGNDCKCTLLDPCGNGEVDFWELCDPKATPTGCPTGDVCNSECVCESCLPICTEKFCGPDGCGGVCPPGCTGQDECVNGQCVCQPACAGKQCGPDGCGSQCPPGCQGALMCDAQGQCECMGETFECGLMCCQPGQKCWQDACCDPKNCVDIGKECGGPWDDGCGGTLECGGCGPNETCDEGQCLCSDGQPKCGEVCCAAGQACHENQCCTPKTCSDVTDECGGPWDDGCGSNLECPDLVCPPEEKCEEGQCVVFCGNGVCDTYDGENCANCAQDCPCKADEACISDIAQPFCCKKDRVCQFGLFFITCCEPGEFCDPDLGCIDSCGNDICNDDAGEDCNNCEVDCGCKEDEVCSEGGLCIPKSPFKSPVKVVGKPERIQFLFAPILYAYAVLAAIGPMGNTVGLYNAEIGASIFTDSFAHGYAAYLLQHPAGPWTLLGCGAGSCWYKTHDPTFGWNVMTVGLPFLGNITDMVPLPEPDPGRVLYVAYDYDQIGLLVTVPTTGLGGPGWEHDENIVFGSSLDGKTGSLISAWAPDYSGMALVAVTDGGDLWWVDNWKAGTPAKAGSALGTNLRQIRCADDHCGITDYGSTNLTLVQWASPAAAPAVKGTVTVGNGAVGLDVRKDGDHWLYLTTGFNDNTYTLTTVAADFSIISNVTTTLTDCTNPGHATFHEDHSIRYLVVSCNGNDQALILEY